MSNKKSLEVRSKFEEDLTKLLDIDQKIFLRTDKKGKKLQLQRFLLSGEDSKEEGGANEA